MSRCLQQSLKCSSSFASRLYSALSVSDIPECLHREQHAPCTQQQWSWPKGAWSTFRSDSPIQWFNELNVPWLSSWVSRRQPTSIFPWLDLGTLQDGLVLTSHQTYRPKVTKRKRCHGFLKRHVLKLLPILLFGIACGRAHKHRSVHMCRIASQGGRRTLERRRNKKRRYLTV